MGVYRSGNDSKVNTAEVSEAEIKDSEETLLSANKDH